MRKRVMFKDVSAGHNHSLALCSDGFVYAWGNNSYGQLGIGEHGNSYCPMQVKEMPSAVLVSAGKYHSLALSKDGSVYAWGGNSCGQLGDGVYDNRTLPIMVDGMPEVISVSAGSYHSLTLDRFGHVWSWGWNRFGQIGNDTDASCPSPIRVNGLSGVVSVSAGEKHSLVLDSDGSTWFFGVMHGPGDSCLSPANINELSGVRSIHAGDIYLLALKTNGTILFCDGQVKPYVIEGLSDIVSVSVGKKHALFLNKDGSVYSRGFNDYGQLGGGDALRALLVLGNKGKYVSTPFKVESLFNVVGISANGDHSLALSRDGFVYAWGKNDYGQLGDGTGANRSVPVCIKNFFITKKLANEDEDNDLVDKLLSNADMLQKNLS